MKRYLDIVPVSARVRSKHNRMSILCIMLSVLLVTTICSMAEMFIRSQIMQSYKADGNWHTLIRQISEEDAALIAARPEVEALSWYNVLNYEASTDYSLSGKPALICGFDETFLRDIYPGISITEGHFPAGAQQAVLTQNAKQLLGLQLGDTVTVEMPQGKTLSVTICGFSDNTASILQYDSYGIFLSVEQFQALAPPDTAANAGVYYVQFSTHCNMQKAIAQIQAQFSLADEQISQNTKLLGLLGQSNDPLMLQLYLTAGILIFLVMIAGVLMIASSLGSNVAQRTQFFGMLRCIGATPKQIIRMVRAQALLWCRLAIPLGVCTGVAAVWVLCAVLRWLSPYYFDGMPVAAVSISGILTGIVIGFVTVLLAAHAPAKRAVKVSPLTAVSGNADAAAPVRNAANTTFFKVDTALGIHHAKANRKNFFLMVGSFALSIILFLSFSVTISFMNHAIKPLDVSTPDVSIISSDNTRSISGALLAPLRENPAVERVYSRMWAYDVPISSGVLGGTIDFISYDAQQFAWAKKSLLEGEIQAAQEDGAALMVYHPRNPFHAGDTVTLHINGEAKTIAIAGMLSTSPFHSGNGFGTLICSEDTFQQLMGAGGYTVIDMQLSSKASNADVQAIRALAGTDASFSDRRASNAEATGAYFAFALFVYGFLVIIALISAFHIINSLAMSVTSRMRQYGAMRAIGMSGSQLVRMVTAEAAAYAFAGSFAGCILGLPVHWFLFDKMVTYRWGDAWQFPLGILATIVVIVVVTAFIAVRGPARRIRNLSIVDTIAAE